MADKGTSPPDDRHQPEHVPFTTARHADQSEAAGRQTYSVSEVDDKSIRYTLADQPSAAPPTSDCADARLTSSGFARRSPCIKVFAVRATTVLRRPRQHLRPGRPAAAEPVPRHPAGQRSRQGLRGRLQCPLIALQVPVVGSCERDPVIGVWATTYRHQVRVFDGREPAAPSGPVGPGGSPRHAAERSRHPARPEGHVQRAAPEERHAVRRRRLFPDGEADARALRLGHPGRRRRSTQASVWVVEDATIFLTGLPGLNKPAHHAAVRAARLNTRPRSTSSTSRTAASSPTT